MTPEQSLELDTIYYLGVFVAVALGIIATQVLHKLNQILERMGPKP